MQETASTVFSNGLFYTVDETQPWADVVAVRDGRFLFVGSPADVEPYIGEETEYIDLGGRLVLPGFIGAHSHPGTADLQSLHRRFNRFGHTALKVVETDGAWMDAVTALEQDEKLSVRLFPASSWTDTEDTDTADTAAESALIYPRYVWIADAPTDDAEWLAALAALNQNGVGIIAQAHDAASTGQWVDAFSAVRSANDNDAPLHLAHAWQITPEEITRLADLEQVCVDFAPSLDISQEDSDKIFNVRAAVEAGLPVGFSSEDTEAPGQDPNAFSTMQGWITRANPNNPNPDLINPAQAITLKQAIKGYTMGGARCLGFGWDSRLGSITTGKLADLIVLDRNVFEVAIDDLYNTRVDLTVVGGKIVYERNVDLTEQPHNKYSTPPEIEPAGSATL